MIGRKKTTASLPVEDNLGPEAAVVEGDIGQIAHLGQFRPSLYRIDIAQRLPFGYRREERLHIRNERHVALHQCHQLLVGLIGGIERFRAEVVSHRLGIVLNVSNQHLAIVLHFLIVRSDGRVILATRREKSQAAQQTGGEG